MAPSKKNIAGLVVQGISVLGILLGFGWIVIAIFMPLTIHRENSDSLWFDLAFSGLLLVLGTWLTRDSYLMLRAKSFGGIKSISGLLAFVFWGWVESLLEGWGTPFVGEKRVVDHMIVFVGGLATLLAAVVVYSICTKLLNRLLKAAYSPEELSGTHHSTG